MSIRPVLFVDIDGVMADSISWWLIIYNYINHTFYRKEDITEWDTKICIKADLSPYFANYGSVEPIDGALSSVDILSSKYRIVYATMGLGSEWLRKYISNPEIILTKDKSLLRGFGLIDDNPMNLDGFIGERFLMSQPWNRGRGLNETTWDEITHYLMNKEIHNER